MFVKSRFLLIKAIPLFSKGVAFYFWCMRKSVMKPAVKTALVVSMVLQMLCVSSALAERKQSVLGNIIGTTKSAITNTYDGIKEDVKNYNTFSFTVTLYNNCEFDNYITIKQPTDDPMLEYMVTSDRLKAGATKSYKLESTQYNPLLRNITIITSTVSGSTSGVVSQFDPSENDQYSESICR